MQIPKIQLHLIEEPPGPVALGRQQPAPVLEPTRGAASDGAHDVQVAQQRVRPGGVRSDRRRRLVRQAEDEPGIGQHELARDVRPGDVALIQPADLPGGQPMRRDRVGEAHPVVRVGARQRDEILHRGVGDDAALPDVLLDGVGQRAHQTEAPRDPAHTPIEPPRQDLQRQAMLLVQRAQQPRLLEHALGGVGLEQMAKDQRVAFRHVPDHRGDRVAVQPMQTADAFVAVDHDVDRRRGHDHDRHLLAGVG